MSDEEKGRTFFGRYGLEEVPRFSDPTHRLYRAFSLPRAPLRTFLRWRGWLRAWQARRAGHPIGRIAGDPLRLGGVFLLDRGNVVRGFRTRTPDELPGVGLSDREAR